MKLYRILSFLFIPVMMMVTFMISSCEDDELGATIDVDGTPEVHYVRVSNPSSADSLLVSAALGNTIAIIGDNLADTRQVWFNDQEAVLAPTWVTNTSIFVTVPNLAPSVVSDIMYLVNSVGDTLKHDFVVAISPPEIHRAKNEWPIPGENLVLTGEFFFEPITITFAGGGVGEVVSMSQSSLEVKVPDGAVEGPVNVTTNFGSGVSPFNVWDTRGTFLNFDDKLASGWRRGILETDPNAVDGNYVVFRGNVGLNQTDEDIVPDDSAWEVQLWGAAAGLPEGNFYPGHSTKYQMKFEAKASTWYGSYLNLCLAPWSHADSNQEIWSNNFNARAVWGPWDEEDADWTTDGEWITISIPMTEFKYARGTDDAGNIAYDEAEFIEQNAGSLSLWMLGSGVSVDSPVELFIDNMRVVEL